MKSAFPYYDSTFAGAKDMQIVIISSIATQVCDMGFVPQQNRISAGGDAMICILTEIVYCDHQIHQFFCIPLILLSHVDQSQ